MLCMYAGICMYVRKCRVCMHYLCGWALTQDAKEWIKLDEEGAKSFASRWEKCVQD